MKLDRWFLSGDPRGWTLSSTFMGTQVHPLTHEHSCTHMKQTKKSCLPFNSIFNLKVYFNKSKKLSEKIIVLFMALERVHALIRISKVTGPSTGTEGVKFLCRKLQGHLPLPPKATLSIEPHSPGNRILLILTLSKTPELFKLQGSHQISSTILSLIPQHTPQDTVCSFRNYPKRPGGAWCGIARL